MRAKAIPGLIYQMRRKALEKKLWYLSAHEDEQIANQRGAITPVESAAIADDVQQKLKCRNTDLVLEIGCGTGLLAKKITDDLKTYIGLDIIYDLLKSAQQNNRSARTNFLKADGQTLPIKSGVIDRILMYSVILYLPPLILKSILQECQRVLKTEGVLFIGDIPNPNNLGEFFKTDNVKTWRIPFLIRKRLLKIWLRKLSNSPCAGWYRPEEIQSLLFKEGFAGTMVPQGPQSPFRHFRYDILATSAGASNVSTD
jgi:ubiquinone/menaquinone biosynthesis C-methylase UbiE